MQEILFIPEKFSDFFLNGLFAKSSSRLADVKQLRTSYNLFLLLYRDIGDERRK